MEHGVPFRKREIAGATLEISTVGGYSVVADGVYVGYLHASQGNLFNAYRRVPTGADAWLGKYAEDEAVRAILRACGRAPKTATDGSPRQPVDLVGPSEMRQTSSDDTARFTAQRRIAPARQQVRAAHQG